MRMAESFLADWAVWVMEMQEMSFSDSLSLGTLLKV